MQFQFPFFFKEDYTCFGGNSVGVQSIDSNNGGNVELDRFIGIQKNER